MNISNGRTLRVVIRNVVDSVSNFDVRDFAATVADSTIADLRKRGFDCVSKGSHDNASHEIRQAIFRAVILSANPPTPEVPQASKTGGMVDEPTVTDLVKRLRKSSADEEKYQQGGGASVILDEAADALEQMAWKLQSALDQADGDNV